MIGGGGGDGGGGGGGCAFQLGVLLQVDDLKMGATLRVPLTNA